MPILNLENPVFISLDGAGRPNSGGTVGVYVAGTSFVTPATIWSDQIKTAELANPVTLDDAGTKEIWFDVNVDIKETFSNGSGYRDTLNIDPNATATVSTGFNLAQNGSFEADSDSDGLPDGWTISPYSGSDIAITSSVATNGVNALEFNTTSAGSGGGTATSAKFPVTEGTICSVAWSFYATNATTLNTFQIKWYNEADALQSTSTLTMPASGAVPTSWTNYTEEVTADAAGTQGEIVLTGISSGGSNLSSKAYFDGIKVINFPNMVTLEGTQILTNKTLTSPTLTSPTLTSPAISSATFSGTQTGFIADSAVIDGVAGSERSLFYKTSGVSRWQALAGADAETGADAGSNFNIARHNDAGAIVDYPLNIARSTGLVTVATNLAVAGLITSSSATRHLISTATASASATVDFSAVLDGTYKLYEVELINVIPATNAVHLYGRVETAGTTWETGALYGVDGTTTAFMQFTSSAVSNTASEGGFSGKVCIINPSSASVFTHTPVSYASYQASAGGVSGTTPANEWKVITAVTGIRFYMSTGNIASGEFRLYGISA